MQPVGIIVQARMSSSRCPGKVLQPIRGKVLLQYLLERLQRHLPDLPLVIATSSETSDDAVADFCRQAGVLCWRGPLQRVAERFRQVVTAYPMAAFVRISGDSPLLDPDLVRQAMALFQAGAWDLVTNVMPRSYPRGQSVELVRTAAFLQACAQIQAPEDQEHVTPFFYRYPERFAIRNFKSPVDWSHLHLAVDTPDDMTRFERLVGALDRPHWQYTLPELLDLWQRR